VNDGGLGFLLLGLQWVIFPPFQNISIPRFPWCTFDLCLIQNFLKNIKTIMIYFKYI
jgi:hypothetical protein